MLGCASGWVMAQLGRPESETVLRLNAGNVVVLPAGMSHCNRGHSPDSQIIGAYPTGQAPDMHDGEPQEFDRVVAAAEAVTRPERDAVLGADGPLITAWS